MMLHLGTLAAIVVYYRAVVVDRRSGACSARTRSRPRIAAPAVIRTGLLAVVATLPLIPLTLFFMKWIEQAFESTHGGRGRVPDHGGGPAA